MEIDAGPKEQIQITQYFFGFPPANFPARFYLGGNYASKYEGLATPPAPESSKLKFVPPAFPSSTLPLNTFQRKGFRY